MSKRSRRTCEICGIKEAHLQSPRFFANYPLEENRCKEWVRVTGNEDLVHLPIEKLHAIKHVCGEHFKNTHINKKKNKLKKQAIPCLNLKGTPLTEEQMSGFQFHLWKNQVSESASTRKEGQRAENENELSLNPEPQSQELNVSPTGNTLSTSNDGLETCNEKTTGLSSVLQLQKLHETETVKSPKISSVAIATRTKGMKRKIPQSDEDAQDSSTLCHLPENNVSHQASSNMAPQTHMCRLCATVTEFVVPIFEGEGLQNRLADKIHQHLPIQVSQTDILPTVMCFQCTSTLLAWHELFVCSVQADTAMRERFNLHLSQSKEQKQPNLSTDEGRIKNEKSQEIGNLLNKVMAEYFQSENLAEDYSQMELVCQKCNSKSALTTDKFVEHLVTEHGSELSNEDTILKFIKEYVTFEEALLSDSEKGDSDWIEQSEIIKPKPLPALFCPYCEIVFSSTSRLVYHLNKHVEMSIDFGAKCCSVPYDNKKDFVDHLQEQHINRLIYDTETMCKSCGFTAETIQDLQTHVGEAHREMPREKKSKKESAKNQKSIPAVCPECNKTFSNKYTMFVHMKSHEKREESLFI